MKFESTALADRRLPLLQPVALRRHHFRARPDNLRQPRSSAPEPQGERGNGLLRGQWLKLDAKIPSERGAVIALTALDHKWGAFLRAPL